MTDFDGERRMTCNDPKCIKCNPYPYTHHGPVVHGSKLEDYFISEANMIEAGILPTSIPKEKE